MNDNALIERAKQNDKDALAALVEKNMGLVKTLAYKFRDRGVDIEDLNQIGTIGLIKAIRNFDFSFNTQFSTYAVPLIMGEIKKFLRDDGMIKVGREVKRNGITLLKEREKFCMEYGREPRISELASACGISVEDAITALDAGSPVFSFSDPVSDDSETTVEDFIGVDNIAPVCENIALRQALGKLNEMERDIIFKRYFLGFSQSKVAEKYNITQVKVSRTEKKIIEKLKKMLA